MDIPLLLSGLNEVPSLSDPIKMLFDRNYAIPEINSLEDINTLLTLKDNLLGRNSDLMFPSVDINIMGIHLKVIKPFVSQLDDEDDFI